MKVKMEMFKIRYYISAFALILLPFTLPISAAANMWRYRLGKQKSDYLWLGLLLFWALCVLLTRDNSYWTLTLSTLLAWLSYKMLYRWGEQADKFTEQKLAWSYGLLLGIATLVLLGVMIYNLQWFSLPFWISASIFAHTVFLFAVIVYMLSPMRWVRVLCFVFTLSTILITGNQETVYAWCLVFIVFSFFSPSAKKQREVLLEPIIISLFLVAMIAFSSVLGWNALGFVIDVLPNQQHNLVQGSETTRGYWWKTQGVDFTTSEALIAGQNHTVFTVEKTEEEHWRRLQQIISITRGQPYTVSTWIQNNDDTKPGIQGWGQLAQSKDTFVITGELRDGQWLASATSLGTLVDSGVAEIAGEWTRVWLTFVYEGGQKELSFFLGLTPDQQNSIGASNSFAGFQVEKGAALSDYVAGAANRGVDLQTARLPYWQAAWQGFLAKPWLGHGEETFSDYYRETWPDKGRLGQIPPHAHNLYLQFLFEKGLLGFIGLVALLLLLGLPAIRQGDLLFSTLFFSILIINFFDGTLFSMSLLYPLAAFSAWRQATYTHEDSQATFKQIGVKVSLGAMDYLVIVLSFWLSSQVASIFGVNDFILTDIIKLSFLLWPLTMFREGLYSGYGLTFAQELQKQTRATFLALLILLMGILLFPNELSMSWVIAIIACIASIVLLPIGRFVSKIILHHFRVWGKKVIIFGAGSEAIKIAKTLHKSPLDGLHPIAFFDDNDNYKTNTTILPIQGNFADAEAFAQQHNINHAIVAMPHIESQQLSKFVHTQDQTFKHVLFMPKFRDLPAYGIQTRSIDNMLALEVTNALAHPLNKLVKRFIDLFGVIIGGLIISPILILLAIAIYIDSPGPIFFGHKRLGKKSKHFKTWKFRTMVPNAQEILIEYLKDNPELKQEWEENHKLQNDPRVTRVGKVLRKYSLDELPQLFNVLLGEMSLVGPRPIVDAEIEKYADDYSLYQMVQPGMTGYWQVSGRSDTDYSYRVALDSFYVRNWSVWLDVEVLLATVKVVIEGDGAY